MKITICASLAFIDEMHKVREELVALGHAVKMPPDFVDDSKGGQISVQDRYRQSKEATNDDVDCWNMRENAMRNHFNKIEWCDAAVIVNHEKNNVPGYIGANTLLEMGLAFHLQKPIYLLYQIPEISYKEEILGMKPVCIDNDLSKII